MTSQNTNQPEDPPKTQPASGFEIVEETEDEKSTMIEKIICAPLDLLIFLKGSYINWVGKRHPAFQVVVAIILIYLGFSAVVYLKHGDNLLAPVINLFASDKDKASETLIRMNDLDGDWILQRYDGPSEWAFRDPAEGDHWKKEVNFIPVKGAKARFVDNGNPHEHDEFYIFQGDKTLMGVFLEPMNDARPNSLSCFTRNERGQTIGRL